MNTTKDLTELIIADYIRHNNRLCEEVKARCPAEFEVIRLFLWYLYSLRN